MGLGAEIDLPLSAVMLRLVSLGSVVPDPARRVQVDGPHEQTSSGRMPERRCSSTIAQTGGDIRPDCVNERIGDRPDRLRLPDIGPAPTETGNGLEAVMDGGRNHRLPDGPLEQSHDYPARRLTSFRQRPDSIMAWRTALSWRGPKSRAGVSP